MKVKYLVVPFLLSIFHDICALPQQQNHEPSFLVQGVVSPLGSRKVLSDVMIIDLSNKANFTRTDAQGRFSLALEHSSVGILIRAENYQDLEVGAKDGKLLQASPYLLEPSPLYGAYGIIRARRKHEISENSFQQEELAHLPGTQGDAIKALQTLPSVLPARLGSANIVVRGGVPGDNSFYYDDLLFPFIFHFGGTETILPTRMIESMDFYPGAFSSLYPDTIGGVIQLKSPGNIPQRFSSEIELGMLKSGVFVEGYFVPHENVSNTNNSLQDAVGYRAGVRRTYLELYKPLLQKIATNSSLMVIPQATDYQLLLNGNHSLGTWQAYLFGAADRASLSSANLGNSITDSGQNTFSFYNYLQTSGVRYNLNLGDGYGLRFFAQQRYFVLSQEIFDNTIDIQSHLFGLGIVLDKKVNHEIFYSMGVRPKYSYNAVGINIYQENSLDPLVFFDPELAPRFQKTIFVDQFYGDLFVDMLYTPVKFLEFDLGVNLLVGPVQSLFAADPRLGLRYKFLKSQIFKIAWGYYSQLPAPQYTTPGYGNENLKVEKSLQYVLGLESQFLEEFSSDIQLWYKTSDSLIGPAVNDPALKYENSILSQAGGLEIFLKKKPSNFWFGWVSYAYSASKRRDPGLKIWLLSNYDRTHALNAVYGQKITNRWNVGARLQYLSGTPYSFLGGGVFHQNTGKYVPLSQSSGASYLPKNDARIPSLFQVDFRTEYDFLFSDWTLTSYLDILNIFNRKNVLNITSNRDYSQQVSVTGLPIMPSVGLVAKF